MNNARKTSAKRVSIYTLGCRLNQSETRIIEERLRALGYVIVPFGESADLGVIHTCVVTGEAEAKSRKYIHRFLRANPHATVAVIGCYAQTAAQSFAKLEGVRLVLGNEAKMLLPDLLQEVSTQSLVVATSFPTTAPFEVNFVKEGPPITTRINLKIQDGCDIHCSYCYVPTARGPSRSRQFKNIVDEAQSLAHRGAREIVLTGVNIGDYYDGNCSLVELIDALDTIQPKLRIRLSSIEISSLSDEILRRMADPDHSLVRHLHIPLQSGSDAVLRAMHRPYQSSEYLEWVRHAIATVPDLGIGADVMVGFPGETDGNFLQTYKLIEQIPLFYLHIFQYSDRPQLPASRLPNKVSVSVKKERSKALAHLACQKKQIFQQQFFGKTLTVLFENKEGVYWKGHADNYLEVACTSDHDLRNACVPVRIEALINNLLVGTLLDR